MPVRFSENAPGMLSHSLQEREGVGGWGSARDSSIKSEQVTCTGGLGVGLERLGGGTLLLLGVPAIAMCKSSLESDKCCARDSC